ncbi:MAG TPA: DUF305 domain-containing protein [Pyrinomonadaceae bacterium]|nr:DUF305 domain-containing protein [Pyrinomonadaceae bacterium]
MNKKLGTRRAASLALAVAAFATLSAFALAVGARAQEHSGHSGHGQTADVPPGLHFIDMAAAHHRQGVETARLAETKAQSAAVKAFAARTASAQEEELKTLQWHRDNHYAGRPLMDEGQTAAHMRAMPGHGAMDAAGDMAKLRAASGRAFDRLFLDTMTRHHEMMVGMAREAATKAEHAEIRELARKSAESQQAEISEMNRLKASLGGAAARKSPAKTSRKPAAKKPAAKKPSHAGHH